ncbi:GNAT family N-acetyltransferase [Hoeflea sp.]|uniref:GNAT family N-acetyltransferase n=1 Tax=Hoeflea sp. TaxID=1940281 RepID=UPI003749B82B
MPDIRIRQTRPLDMPAIQALYPAAFPDEDLLPVVGQLLAGVPGLISLGAFQHESLVGHVIFTPCAADADATAKLSLLAPLAVAPESQRKSIGTALIREGLNRLKSGGISQVFVLGDPAYYGRSGFRPETTIAPPHPLPDEYRDAWQSLTLDATVHPASGNLAVPAPWRDPALWRP